MDKTNSATFANMTEEELDLLLGEALLQDSLGSKAMADDEKRKVAQNWFRANMPTFASLICDQSNIINFLAGPEKKERNELIAGMAEVLMKASGINFSIVPVAIIAVKLWHYGVAQLCAESSKE